MSRTFPLILLMLIIAACSPDSNPTGQSAVPTSTPIPTAPAAARPTFTVERGTVQEVQEFTGRWLPRDQIELSFEVNGTIRQVNVARGDVVSAGTLLADYQIQDLEDNLDSAQLSLDTAILQLQSGGSGSEQAVANAQVSLANSRLSLEDVRNSAPWTSLENARISLENAELDLVSAERDYNEALSMPESANSASTVDNAYQALKRAQNSVVTAQNNYFSAAQSFNSYMISVDQAENSVIQNELNLQNAQTGGGEDFAQALQSVNSAQLNVDQIKEQIAQSSLYAPIDAVVLEVAITPGTAVEAFTAVITLALPEPLEAIATLAFNDIQRLSIGQVGVCYPLNFEDQAVQCVIRQIPLSNREADQTVRVAATLPNVQQGQVINMEMPLETSVDVLYLPPEAIRTFQNRSFVIVQTPDGEQIQDVQIGLETDTRVEIVSGVQEGDVVVGP